MSIQNHSYTGKVVSFLATLPNFWEAVLAPILQKQGWNQSQLAERVGGDKSLVSRWKDGIIPDETYLNRLRELHEIDVEFWIVQQEVQNMRKRLKRKRIDPDKYFPAAA